MTQIVSIETEASLFDAGDHDPAVEIWERIPDVLRRLGTILVQNQ